MRGLRSGVGKEYDFVVESYMEVPVVEKHVLFSLSAVCFELKDFCLCCRLCKVSHLGGSCVVGQGKN